MDLKEKNMVADNVRGQSKNTEDQSLMSLWFLKKGFFCVCMSYSFLQEIKACMASQCSKWKGFNLLIQAATNNFFIIGQNSFKNRIS